MIRAIIVDDEVKSIGNLQILLKPYANELQVVATANSAIRALKEIQTHKPEMMFVDIQMPGFNGFELLEQVKNIIRFPVFITGHKEFAIQALHQGAFDYLLKPFDSVDISNCLTRIKNDGKHHQMEKSARKLVELSVKSGILYLKQEEIVFVAASGSYTEFYMDNHTRHVVSKNMKSYLAQFDSDLFYRCHNSYIVNLTKVNQFLHHEGLFAEMSNGMRVNISRRNKEEFLMKLKSK